MCIRDRCCSAYDKKDWYFLIRLGRRGYLLAVLRRDVVVGSHGLGRRECRLDAGSKIHLKNLRDSCSLRSDRLGIFAQRVWYGMV